MVWTGLPRCEYLPTRSTLQPSPSPPSLPVNSIAHNKDTFVKLVAFSIVLFVLGLGPFYIISRTSYGEFVAETQQGRDNIGAIVAVATTNLVIAAYVYSAFQEPVDPSPRGQQLGQQVPIDSKDE